MWCFIIKHPIFFSMFFFSFFMRHVPEHYPLLKVFHLAPACTTFIHNVFYVTSDFYLFIYQSIKVKSPPPTFLWNFTIHLKPNAPPPSGAKRREILLNFIFALSFFHEILSHNYSNSVRKSSIKTFSYYYPIYFFGKNQRRDAYGNMSWFPPIQCNFYFPPSTYSFYFPRVLISYIFSLVLTSYIFRPELTAHLYPSTSYIPQVLTAYVFRPVLSVCIFTSVLTAHLPPVYTSYIFSPVLKSYIFSSELTAHLFTPVHPISPHRQRWMSVLSRKYMMSVLGGNMMYMLGGNMGCLLG